MPNKGHISLKGLLRYLMTAEQYALLRHDTPYIFLLKSGNKQLFYFGSRHSNNPADHMYKRLTQALRDFKPDLVCIEGNPRVNSLSRRELQGHIGKRTAKEIIMQRGESGFSLQWSVKHGVTVYSPEPSDADLMAGVLAQGFGKDNLFVYWTCAVLHQWHRQKIKPPYQDYLGHFYNIWKQTWGWPKYDFSLEHYKKLHAKVFKRTFNIRALILFREASDPIPWPDKKSYGIINRTANATSKFRDAYMIGELNKWFSKGKKRIFVVFGSSHAVHQEPALRKMFDDLAHMV